MQNHFGIKIKKGITMGKKIINIVFLCLLPSFLFSHSLILNIDDNEDGTITVEGVFNTGQLAPGAEIRMESLVTGEVLYKKRLPDESELTINIPKVPYQVVLDGGPGHQVVKDGIEPEGGFAKELNKESKEVKLSKSRNSMQELPFEMIISIVVAFILLFITIFISIKNTNKLIRELQERK